MNKPVRERILAKVRVTSSGCWEWTGSRSRGGYGLISMKGKNRSVHRITYELDVAPIPVGLELDHLCRNRACCNPAHLEPVTRTENVRRGAACKRTATHCAQGHEITPETVILRRRRAQWECRVCAREAARRARAKSPRCLAPFRPTQTGLRGVNVHRDSAHSTPRYLAKLGGSRDLWRGPRRLNPIQAAFDYDEAAFARKGSLARLNFPCRFTGVGR